MLASASAASAAVVERLLRERLVLGELAGGVLELLVLDELAHEVEARVHPLLVRPLVGLAAVDGEHHAALDHHERGGHHDELARHVEVELAHEVEVLHVLLGDAPDRDVVDVQFLAADQVQKQVKRALEYLEVHLVVFCK